MGDVKTDYIDGLTLDTLERLIENGQGKKIGYQNKNGKYTYKRLLKEIRWETELGKEFKEFVREGEEKILLKKELLEDFALDVEEGKGDEVIYEHEYGNFTIKEMLEQLQEMTSVAEEYLDEIYEDQKNAPYKDKLIKFLKELSDEERDAAKKITVKLLELEESAEKDLYQLIEEDIYTYKDLYTALFGAHENIGLTGAVSMMGDMEESSLFSVLFGKFGK